MSRYKIATKTDTLRYKIAKEVFGEIEDSDGVRDIPSWEIFEKCLEQHKRIAELEEQIDYSFKINTWLIEKYGKEFWQDIGIYEDDDTITNLIKLDEMFDKIYEEMNKEMPKKWYEYGFGSKK